MSDKQDALAEHYADELLFLDPAEQFDDCIVGVAERCGMPPSVVYDKDKVVLALMRDGIDHDEAVEFLEFNILGAYVGDQTPLMMDLHNA